MDLLGNNNNIKEAYITQVVHLYRIGYVSFSNGSDRFKLTIRDKLSIDCLLHSGLFVSAFTLLG